MFVQSCPMSIAGKPAEAESETKDDNSDDASGNSKATTEMDLKAVNEFRSASVLERFKMLEFSKDSQNLGICESGRSAGDVMGPVFVKILERKIEILQWQMFHAHQAGEANITVNLAQGKKDQFIVKLPVHGSLCLPFAGSISCSPPSSSASKSQAHLFCTFLGMHFYVQPKGIDLNTSDVVVPAWAVKAVSKPADAFLEQDVVRNDFVALLPLNARPHDMSLHLITPDNSDSVKELIAECENAGGHVCGSSFIGQTFLICFCSGYVTVDSKPFSQFSQLQSGRGQAQLQVAKPLHNLQQKIEDDLAKDKEKAEKTAKNLVQSALRRNQNREAKESKKRKKQQAQVDNDIERLQMEVSNNKADLEKLKHAEEEEAHVQEAIAKALASCKPRTSIPLTVLAAKETVEKSARAKAMQSALQEAEAKLAGALAPTPSSASTPKPSGQESAVGVRAVLVALHDDGALEPKKVNKNKKDDKALTTAEMRKLGKHLLK